MDSEDIFKVTMVNKLINYDWNRPSPHLWTSYFDDASSLLTTDPEMIHEFNRREKEFHTKFGLSIAQAEERLYKRMMTGQGKILVFKKKHKHDQVGSRLRPGQTSKRVSYYDILDELRGLRVWTINKVKAVAETMDPGLFMG